VATTIPLVAVVGAAYLIRGWLSRPRGAVTQRPLLRTILGFLVGAVGASMVTALGYLALRARPPTPDAFYDPTPTVPPQPGTLLRAEPFPGVVPAETRVWRILYSTTRADNVPAIASAIVLAPAPPSADPRPVVAWTHGSTGVAEGCAPSVLPAPFPFDPTVPALKQLIAEKWVLVGTDYVGLGTTGGHPYLIGEAEGRSALDAVRAVGQLKEVKVDPRAVVWGHSQGGHAALWTGILAPRYAPDISLLGVAALAPATEIGALVEAAQHTPVGKIMASFVMTAYSQTYRDVGFNEYVGPVARARAMASRCLSGPGALLPVLTALTMERNFFLRPPVQGQLGERFKENVPTGHIAVPLLIGQGLSDDLVLPTVQERFVRERCAAGQPLEYRTYAGRDHVSVVAPDSPEDLMRWTRDRFSAVPIEGGCRTVAR
jgi:pimeloyl-ACP methyl ester carboxylesterase